MKRSLIVGAAAGALLLSSTPFALAAEPKPIAIEHGIACGTVTLTFTNPVTDVDATHGFRWNAVAGDVATGEGAHTGLVTVGPGATVKETIRLAEDEFGGTAAVTVAVAFGPNSHVQPRLDLYPVDTDCTDEEPEPTPTTPPAEPTPTTPPAEPKTPNNAFNCDDFATRADAQAKFDEDPTDPHNLDFDGNGLACERHFDENIGVQDEDDILTPVATPSGGVATGGGPRR